MLYICLWSAETTLLDSFHLFSRAKRLINTRLIQNNTFCWLFHWKHSFPKPQSHINLDMKFKPTVILTPNPIFNLFLPLKDSSSYSNQGLISRLSSKAKIQWSQLISPEPAAIKLSPEQTTTKLIPQRMHSQSQQTTRILFLLCLQHVTKKSLNNQTWFKQANSFS